MPVDNVPLPPNAGRVATREVPYSGQDAHVQVVGLALLSGPNDGKTATDVDASNPLPVLTGNMRGKFRDSFEVYVPNTGGRWMENKATGDLVYADGNAAASSYLVISKSPLLQGTETVIELDASWHFRMPAEISIGAHMSQRTLGQEFAIEVVDTGSPLADVPDLAILSITQVGTTLTVQTAQPHALSVGKSFGLRGMPDSRMNYPSLVLSAVPGPNLFQCTAGPGGTIPSTSANLTTALASTTGPLTATYANGTLGVGATLTATVNEAFPAQDGVPITLGARLLVKDQAAQPENGLYVLTQLGDAGTPWILTRAPEFDTAADMTPVAGARMSVSVFVQQGQAGNAGAVWVLLAAVATVGTTAVTFGRLTATRPALGYVYFRERFGRSRNGVSQLFENATATNASLYIRSEAGDALPSGTIAGNHSVTIGTTASVQLVNSPGQFAFTATNQLLFLMLADRVQWADVPVDSTAQSASRLVRSQVCPDPSETYKLRIRATNNKALTVPIGQIVTAIKTGTTTAELELDRDHDLEVGDLVVSYGTRAQGAAEFPNVTAATPVLSVVDNRRITVAIGTAGTITSHGGYVARVHGGNLPSVLGAVAQVVQSATLTTLSDGTRQLTLIGSAAWAAPATTIGDMLELVGCRADPGGATLAVDGPWKVASAATTALTLVLPFADQRTLPADFATTNCGGALIKRTCLRLSFVRIFDYERLRVEALSRPAGDAAAAMPVSLQGGTAAATQSGTWNVGQVLGTAATRWFAQLSDGTNSPAVKAASTAAVVADAALVAALSPNYNAPVPVVDVASLALTASATTGALTPTGGTSYQVVIPVTAIAGTSPTLDVTVEESDDSGTNWFRVYDFPRITATGVYRSPKLPLTGNRLRYVQTVSGAGASFTRAINRNQGYDSVPVLRQLIDRSIVLTTANSNTPALNVQGCRNVQLVLNIGTATTPPSLQLEGSDDNGASWYPIGSPLAAVASSTVQLTASSVQAGLARARVSSAGATVVAGYTLLKGF